MLALVPLWAFYAISEGTLLPLHATWYFAGSEGARSAFCECSAPRADRFGRCTWANYNLSFGAVLDELAADGVTHVVFGDILYPEHREWAENICAQHNLVAVEPLFGSSTRDLFVEWVSSGAEAAIVTTRAERLDASWMGRTLSLDMLAEFDRLAVAANSAARWSGSAVLPEAHPTMRPRPTTAAPSIGSVVRSGIGRGGSMGNG